MVKFETFERFERFEGFETFEKFEKFERFPFSPSPLLTFSLHLNLPSRIRVSPFPS